MAKSRNRVSVMSRWNKRSESAAVLPLVLLLMVAMLTFLAFVINTGFLTLTNEQSKHYARFAALAAIENYFDTLACDDGAGGSRNCSPQERYDSALARVNTVFAENYLFGASGSKASIVAPDDSDAANQAVLEPGTWYASQVEDENGDPINPPCGPSPCFEPLAYPLESTFQIDNTHPNAFRIAGKMYEAAPSRFGYSFLGSSQWEYDVKATATLVPRRGCILVDVSTSMVRDTHVNWNYNVIDYYNWREAGHPVGFGPLEDGMAGFGNEFAFHIDSCDFASANPMDWIVDPQCGRYYWMNQMKPVRGANPAVDTEHYEDDYIEKVVLSDLDYGTYLNRDLHPDPYNPVPPNEPGSLYQIGDTNLRYKIDSFFLSPTSGSYEGPQPLEAVFQGIQAAIRTLKNRRVGGDMLCVVFYDQGLAWPRVLNITDDFDALLEYTRFNDLDDAGNSLHPDGIASDPIGQNAHFGEDGGNPVGFELIARHHLFPGAGAFTSTLTALQEGLRQLTYMQDVSQVPSSDFLVLVGDGLTNCTSCPADCDTCSHTCNPPCQNSYTLYQNSMAEINWFVTEKIEPRNIPIHALLMGSVRPHTKFIYGINEDGEAKCLTSQEAMAVGYLPVDGGVFIDGTYVANPTSSQLSQSFQMPGDDYAFQQVNYDLANIVRRTGGIWAPVRPQVGTPGSCTEPSAPDNCGAAGSRQYNDPYCRPIGEQVVAYFEDILRTNPFSLVEVD